MIDRQAQRCSAWVVLVLIVDEHAFSVCKQGLSQEAFGSLWFQHSRSQGHCPTLQPFVDAMENLMQVLVRVMCRRGQESRFACYGTVFSAVVSYSSTGPG